MCKIIVLSKISICSPGIIIKVVKYLYFWWRSHPTHTSVQSCRKVQTSWERRSGEARFPAKVRDFATKRQIHIYRWGTNRVLVSCVCVLSTDAMLEPGVEYKQLNSCTLNVHCTVLSSLAQTRYPTYFAWLQFFPFCKMFFCDMFVRNSFSFQTLHYFTIWI